MNGIVRLLIVSKNRLYREGLALALIPVDWLRVVGQLSDREAVLAHLRSSSVDALLLDVSGSESHELVRAGRVIAPTVPIVALGLGESEGDILSWIEAGVVAYLTDDDSVDYLVSTVDRAVRGELVCSPRLAGSLVRKVAALAAHRHQNVGDMPLTRREYEIGSLLEQHLSNKEIAARLGIEVATVKNHVHNLLEKLGVRRRTDAARVLHSALK